ncbi:hypothetical protein DYB28_015545, partial [Aphanomyces astaci]
MGTLRSYTDATRVRYDVETLLRQIPSISPQNGVYTHNNGSTSTMLSLTGTIPIYYGGNQYNIPVEIWMPEAYPFAAPTCFVRPTTDMMYSPYQPAVIDPVVKLKAEATEKIQHELQKIYKRIRDEIDDQFDTQRELSHGQQRLAHGQQSLEKLQADLTTAVAQVEAADAQVTDWLAANENQDEVGVDDVLVAADPLSQQQLDAYAERNAIEDALYFMDRALANGEIELPTFLK